MFKRQEKSATEDEFAEQRRGRVAKDQVEEGLKVFHMQGYYLLVHTQRC